MTPTETGHAMDKSTPLLITGAAGFVGRNLAHTLKAQGYKNLMLYDINSPEGALEEYAAKAAGVFHLAGVNRPKDPGEFYAGNADLTTQLLAALKTAGNKAAVLLSSTAQAGNGTDYAKSKEQAELAVFKHGMENSSPVMVYRLPGVFGKWSRPSYNTVVATFCHNTARGLPIEVRDPAFALPLCYIDDVVASFAARMEQALAAPEDFVPAAEAEPAYFGIDPTYEVTLGWLAGTIRSFPKTRETLGLPDMSDAITRKLWATYLSFLPPEKYGYDLTPHTDERGSFTEFIRTPDRGQVSVNVSRPGVTKGNHWHNTKNEKFLVVSGEGVIRIRALDSGEVHEFPVSGAKPQVIDIPPGSTHNIQNTGAGDMVTIMWANEAFDADCPDTYYEEV